MAMLLICSFLLCRMEGAPVKGKANFSQMLYISEKLSYTLSTCLSTPDIRSRTRELEWRVKSAQGRQLVGNKEYLRNKAVCSLHSSVAVELQ